VHELRHDVGPCACQARVDARIVWSRATRPRKAWSEIDEGKIAQSSRQV